jgi:hypothetical protein
MTELQALQNAANCIGLTIHEKHPEDKRKTVKKYFAQRGIETVSPVLDYENLNHFLFGWIMANKASLKNFVVRSRQSGDIIEEGLTEQQAKDTIAIYEQEDKKNGTYEPDFYEAVQMFALLISNGTVDLFENRQTIFERLGTITVLPSYCEVKLLTLNQ